MKTIELVAGIIENDGKILCMQRDQGKHDYISFKWEFPGGKIEIGETKEQALVRELQEEMELDVEVVEHFLDIEHQYPDFIIKMYCFRCNTEDLNFKLNVHKDFKWLPKEELLTLDWAEADKPIVNKLVNM